MLIEPQAVPKASVLVNLPLTTPAAALRFRSSAHLLTPLLEIAAALIAMPWPHDLMRFPHPRLPLPFFPRYTYFTGTSTVTPPFAISGMARMG